MLEVARHLWATLLSRVSTWAVLAVGSVKWGFAAIVGGATAIAAFLGYWVWTVFEANSALDNSDDALTYDAFAGALPSNGQYLAPVIWQVYQESGVSPFVLAGIIAQESDFGDTLTPRGPGGSQVGGLGKGLMQIDASPKNFAAWIAANNWQDP